MTTKSNTRCVLVVDDDDSVRDYLTVILRDAGYSVIALSNGQLALDHLEHATVDVVLLDLMMPVLDGWQTHAALKSRAALREIPIIILSAIDDDAPSDVVATLVKPEGIDELLPLLERLLPRDRRRSARYPAQLDVVAKASPGIINTTTCDVSSGGLSFVVAVPPRVGEHMILSVDLAAHGVARIAAEVRHAIAIDGGWRVGTAFVDIQQNADGFAQQLALLACTTSPL